MAHHRKSLTRVVTIKLHFVLKTRGPASGRNPEMLDDKAGAAQDGSSLGGIGTVSTCAFGNNGNSGCNDAI